MTLEFLPPGLVLMAGGLLLLATRGVARSALLLLLPLLTLRPDLATA